MRGAEHVEEKPIAAPAGPIARLDPGCRQNVLRHARSILYFSKDLPCRCGLGNLARAAGRREVPEKRGFHQVRRTEPSGQVNLLKMRLERSRFESGGRMRVWLSQP